MSKENGSRDVSTINDTSIQSKIFVGIKSKVNDIPNMYRAYNLLGRTASLDEYGGKYYDFNSCLVCKILYGIWALQA